jgi:uncharacterized protein (TIGR02246 family)
MSRALSPSLAALVLLTAAAPAVAASPPSAVALLQEGYVAAWDRADAQAISRFFATDGDFTNPTGFHAKGRAKIAAFYARAFSAGYAGSEGRFELDRAHAVAPGVMVVDGRFSIQGARTPDGAPRPREVGAATAVLVRTAGTWRIAALREQEPPAR